ncbi:MAG: cysteine synthase A [Muribaculaceae bacterium]|nr:cysteine synthase A [Muribaculaceae bacterium]
MIYDSITEVIGNTPMVKISSLDGQKAEILVKIESFNPGGSVKDRIALAMIEDAERRGTLRPGATIIEPTSGNTGIGLAWVGIAKGYKVILTMPDTMSVERRGLLRAYGAEIRLTPGAEGMKGAIAEAERLKKEIDRAVILGQFTNPANPAAHAATTGKEILRDTDGKVDIFVAGVGTGGTVSGVAKALKAEIADVEIVAVEPATSAVISTGVAGKHKIQGIGAGFVPDTFDSALIDRIVTATDEEAFEGARLLARRYGILAGISSGAAFSVAVALSRLDENVGRRIVALLPDTGERYISTNLFNE